MPASENAASVRRAMRSSGTSFVRGPAATSMRLRALLARDGRLEAQRRERRERRTSRRRRPGRSAGRGRSCPSRRGRRSRRTRGPSRRCRSRRRRRPPRRRPAAENASGRKSFPAVQAFFAPAAVSRRFFAPRSTPSMKSKGCIHVPFTPAGARPIFRNCSATHAAARSPSGVPERRPLRSSEARNATSAWTRAAAGESAGAGAGWARARADRARRAREAAVRNIFIRRSLPRNPRACDRATAPRATGAAAALSLR